MQYVDRLNVEWLTVKIQYMYVELLNVKNTQRRKTERRTNVSRMLTNDKKKTERRIWVLNGPTSKNPEAVRLG